MLTSSQVMMIVEPARFALAERAGLPSNCTFTGQVFLPHDIFWARAVEMPMIDGSIAKAPFIMGVVCFRVDVNNGLFVDPNWYVEVLVTFDADNRAVAADAKSTAHRYTPVEGFTQPDNLIHDCNAIMQVLELAEQNP